MQNCYWHNLPHHIEPTDITYPDIGASYATKTGLGKPILWEHALRHNHEFVVIHAQHVGAQPCWVWQIFFKAYARSWPKSDFWHNLPRLPLHVCCCICCIIDAVCYVRCLLLQCVYYYCSMSLLNHQPFLSLVLTCLRGKEEQRTEFVGQLEPQFAIFIEKAKEVCCTTHHRPVRYCNIRCTTHHGPVRYCNIRCTTHHRICP